MSDPVTVYYDQNPELEWNRLFVTPYRRIEYEVVLYYLDHYLPPTGLILDLGGGPGRYTLYLARKEYQVVLLDISSANIQFARDKIQKAGVSRWVRQAAVADARDLRFIPDHTFDALLCMGPLYHLPKLEDRLQCLRECHRVMKPGAPLFLTLLPRCTYLRDALRAGNFEPSVQTGLSAIEEILERGTSSLSQVPNMYFCHPEEAEDWLELSGFELIKLVSTHGFASFMDDRVNQLSKNASTWSVLLKLVLATCTDPNSFSAAEHLFGIAKRKP
jgi:ubiquinone/menaquinone biosynthesis C-methylase UbiE